MHMKKDAQVVQKWLKEYELDKLFPSPNYEEFSIHTVNKGEHLCSIGEDIHHLYFLVSGKLKVYTNLPNGRSLLIRFNQPLSIIGELELVTKEPAKHSVETVQESVLLAVQYDYIYKHHYQHPAFLRYLLHHLSYRLYTASNSSSLNLLTTVENRFASYLMSIYNPEEGSLVEEIKTANLTETAELLGTSYRHLNRVIKELCEKKMIQRKKGVVSILDPVRLETLADGNLYR
ncbi:Crp/Fnr family transcriptional regulator [Bacillus coahuilensis]|uniref:Crp/Fnr family transcriptional regulator n=1 Tax=Bacillus coahuilensis TaxID=408580 RepID=UPI00018512E8|nr:cyclic nucleotide-binding domain-containing protein [Bacillus coahuilensis]